jgi:hypothetical protein
MTQKTDETREAVWSILVKVCNRRNGLRDSSTALCGHAGNVGNHCAAEICPVVRKLIKACWPATPLYPHIEPVGRGR